MDATTADTPQQTKGSTLKAGASQKPYDLTLNPNCWRQEEQSDKNGLPFNPFPDTF